MMIFRTFWNFLLKNKYALIIAFILGLIPLFLMHITSVFVHIIVVLSLLISLFISLVKFFMKKQLGKISMVLIIGLTYLITLNLGVLVKGIYYKSKVEAATTQLLEYRKKHEKLPDSLSELNTNNSFSSLNYNDVDHQNFMISYDLCYWRSHVYGSEEGRWLHLNSLGFEDLVFTLLPSNS